MSPRQDQRDRFVLIQKPYVSVVWGYAPKTFLYHATEDGLRSVCRARTVLDDADAPECFDRSSDIIACQRCIGMVRRIVDPIEARARALEIAAKRAEWVKLPRIEPRCSSGKVLR